jgi:hypothetical protein
MSELVRILVRTRITSLNTLMPMFYFYMCIIHTTPVDRFCNFEILTHTTFTFSVLEIRGHGLHGTPETSHISWNQKNRVLVVIVVPHIVKPFYCIRTVSVDSSDCKVICVKYLTATAALRTFLLSQDQMSIQRLSHLSQQQPFSHYSTISCSCLYTRSIHRLCPLE